MPITRFVCPSCGDVEVDLDHFERTACGEQVHPDFAGAVLWSERTHYRHGDRVIGVTDLIGCPRKAAIRHDEDYAVNPLDVNAPLGGTAWHTIMVSGSKEPAKCEVSLRGTIDGIEVVGQADRVRDGLIEDWKVTNDFDAKRRREEGAKADHMAQVSLYAELAEQMNGPASRPSRGIVWYRHQVKPGLVPCAFDIWPLERVLAYKPADGISTVRDHLHWMARWVRRDVSWRDMPLAGERQSYGAKDACTYCTVRGQCKTAARGAEF